MPKSVWILADDRAGNVNQLLGIAEALNWPFERKEIRYDKWVCLPNWIRGATLIGTDKTTRVNLTPSWPDVVLSAGRRSFPVARFIKRKNNNQTKIIQLMNPGSSQFSFADVVVLPEHDLYRGKASNVMIIAGTPNRITSDVLNQAKEKWQKQLFGPTPVVSVIVGGATKNKPFTLDMADLLVQRICALNPQMVHVTTSRRTPPAVVEFLKKHLPKIGLFFVFGDSGENPYFGLLSCADILVVTGDSMSMCSECCATGKPVFIFAPNEMMSEKHKRFHSVLYRNGYAIDLEKGDAFSFEQKKFCNPSDLIANQIKKLF